MHADLRIVASLLVVLATLPLPAKAQSTQQSPDPSAFVSSSAHSANSSDLPAAPGASTSRPAPRYRRERAPVHPFSQVALGVKLNSLGPGFELATPLARTLNLRAGGNFFHYAYPFTVDGIAYDAQLHFANAQVSLDWFPFHGGFHLSPGFLVFNNRLSANAAVPGGRTFKLAGYTFTSGLTNPVHGDAGLKFSRQFAPSLVFGFGNILPRSGRHISVPFELGAAYVGQPIININLAGTACISLGCYDTSDPQIQGPLKTEQNSLNKDLTQLEFYPILSTGIAYRF